MIMPAEQATRMTESSMVDLHRDEIESNINKAIIEAAREGRYSVDYIATGRDRLLKEHPKSFKVSLVDAKYSVSLIYDEDFRAGMCELKSLRISWAKK